MEELGSAMDDTMVKERENELYTLQTKVNQLQEKADELDRIKASRGWRFLVALYRILYFFVPPNSRRRAFFRGVRIAIKNPRLISLRRIKNFMRHVAREDHDTLAQTINNFEEFNAPLQNIPVVLSTEELLEIDWEIMQLPTFEHPLVSIVIPAYNQFPYTYGCIKTILDNTTDITYEVILADDQSTDQTQNADEYFQNIVISRTQQNLGFLQNCNLAAIKARGRYIHFLNNDTNVQPGWLSSLAELLESDSTVGMTGSKLVYKDNRLQEAGGIVWKDGSAWNYGRLDDPELPQYNYVREADYISGASIMIRRDLWKEIGGFDQRYMPAYYEDTDLAFEVRRHGYRVVYQPKSVVVHFEGISHGTNENSGLKAYQMENGKKFHDKWKDILRAEHRSNAEDVFLARERNPGGKTLLVVDHYVPHFDRDAGGRSTFQYIKLFLELGYKVKFIGDNFFPHQPYTETLQQMGVEVLCGNYYFAHWQQWIKDNGKYFDVVFLNRPHISIKYVDLLRRCSRAKLVYFGHDLHYLREMRKYEVTGNEIDRKSSEEWRKKEFDLMRKVDISYFFSYVEIEEIRRTDPSISCKAVPLNVLDDKQPEPLPGGRQNLLFVGGFGHDPNIDAVIWFHDEIFPIVRQFLPDVAIHIVGSKPPEKIQALHSKNFRIEGFVSDEELMKLYRECRITVVPLRYGAGIKGKVVEAMYNQSPLITTSIGAEGLENVDKAIFVEDEAQEFARCIVELYTNEDKQREFAQKGFEYAMKYFTRKSVVEAIREDLGL